MRILERNLAFNWRTLAMVVFLGIATGACTETQYTRISDATDDPSALAKQVAYQIDPAFYEEFPECILVLPPSPANSISAELSSMIEYAITRHMMQKFNRVISGAERQIADERLGISPHDPIYVKRLLSGFGCDTFLTTKVLNPRIDYLLVWSQVGIGLEMTLSRVADQKDVWRARHLARRSEGGISLSPIGAIVDTVLSTRFASDRDVVEGVIDDAVRRMLVPLPNTKSFSAVKAKPLGS